MSREELDKQMPVSPPIVNRKMKPRTQIIGVENCSFDP
jgi:hypothetical protein